jgi:hypothetical protein
MMKRVRASRWAGVPVLSSLVLSLAACGGPAYEKQFKLSYHKSYTDSCVRTAVKNGMPSADAQAVCACQAQHLVDHHTAGELTKLSMNMKSPEARTAFTEAMTSCLKPAS